MQLSKLFIWSGLAISAVVIAVGLIILLLWGCVYVFGDPAPIRVRGVVYEWINAPPGSNGEIHVGTDFAIPNATADKKVYAVDTAAITFWTERHGQLEYFGFQNVRFNSEMVFDASVYNKPIPNRVVINIILPGFKTLAYEFSPKDYDYMSLSMAIFMVPE